MAREPKEHRAHRDEGDHDGASPKKGDLEHDRLEARGPVLADPPWIRVSKAVVIMADLISAGVAFGRSPR